MEYWIIGGLIAAFVGFLAYRASLPSATGSGGSRPDGAKGPDLPK